MLRRKFIGSLFGTLAAGLLLGALATHPLQAQEASPANDSGKKLPSPPAQASVTLDGKLVTIDYNAPSMRGRKIMGDLVPYDKVWRTGANPATTLKTAVNLKIGDLTVPAGTYTIYSLPSESDLEADHQQADQAVGHRLQPGPGPRTHRHEEGANAFGARRAVRHQVRTHQRQDDAAAPDLGKHGRLRAGDGRIADNPLFRFGATSIWQRRALPSPTAPAPSRP